MFTLTLLADLALSPEQLDTFISLLFSPFVAIASLTTFVVGLSAVVALATAEDAASARDRVEQAIAYGTARAFVVSILPAGLLIASAIGAYT
jgi:hypothetical protein